MKHFLLLSLFLYTISPAQNYGLQENFESELADQRWSTLDLDGDGKTWNLTPANTRTTSLGFSGYTYVSNSYDQVTDEGLNPDNVLVSPGFLYEYPHIKNVNYILGISFRISASDPSKFAETYALYMLPANQTFTGNETPLYFETLTSGTASKVVLVDNYNPNIFGTEVKLYFRHYNSENQSALLIDDITNYNFTAGTTDLITKNKLVIYPNPATTELKINLKNETVQSVEVMDITGKKFAAKEKNNTVNVKTLAPGIYFIKIKTNKNSYINRFIKE